MQSVFSVQLLSMRKILISQSQKMGRMATRVFSASESQQTDTDFKKPKSGLFFAELELQPSVTLQDRGGHGGVQRTARKGLITSLSTFQTPRTLGQSANRSHPCLPHSSAWSPLKPARSENTIFQSTQPCQKVTL